MKVPILRKLDTWFIMICDNVQFYLDIAVTIQLKIGGHLKTEIVLR